jgi:lipopolysaccharide biosynthesis glycosyltransferase
MKPIPIVVGFDQREAVAYHVFCQSVLEKASRPVQFIPLAINSLKFYTETHSDGSNRFIYSRFLTPYLCGFEGPAIFADGDMVCHADMAELMDLFDPTMAAQVVKHDYKTKASVKYLGNKNQDYPRKNWSSVILWNCGHEANRVLTPEFVQNQPGSFLHRFSWLNDAQIGELPKIWNWLATEYEDNPDAKLVHYTLGTPCFKDFAQAPMAKDWWNAHRASQEGMDV